LHNACGHTLTKAKLPIGSVNSYGNQFPELRFFVSTTLYLSLYGVPNDSVKIGRNVKQLLPVPQPPLGQFYLLQPFVPVTKFAEMVISDCSEKSKIISR